MSDGGDVIEGIFHEALIWLIEQDNGFILAINPNTTVLIVKSFSLPFQLFSHSVKVGISILIKVVKNHKPEQIKAKEDVTESTKGKYLGNDEKDHDGYDHAFYKELGFLWTVFNWYDFGFA